MKVKGQRSGQCPTLRDTPGRQPGLTMLRPGALPACPNSRTGPLGSLHNFPTYIILTDLHNCDIEMVINSMKCDRCKRLRDGEGKAREAVIES